MSKTVPSGSAHRQKGAVLAISMIFLIIVTLIGVYAANTATMDVRMARNMQAQMESAQAAEAGLNAALETLVQPGTGDVLFTSTAVPTAVNIGSQLDNLNSGSASVAISIAYMGRDTTSKPLTPSGLPVGNNTSELCDFHRITSAHEAADASSAVGARVVHCYFSN